jgi:hypothetical protein
MRESFALLAAVVERGHIGGARLVVDERHLAEMIAGPERDALASDGDFDLTLGDEIDHIGFLTDTNDALAGLRAAPRLLGWPLHRSGQVCRVARTTSAA